VLAFFNGLGEGGNSGDRGAVTGRSFQLDIWENPVETGMENVTGKNDVQSRPWEQVKVGSRIPMSIK